MRVKDKYLNPFTDFGFKKLFGIEPNKDLLIDFLNELLRRDEGEIRDITYLSPEQLGRTSGERKAIFDIYCENAQGEKFIVETQQAKQNYFKDRSIYYSTFPIQNQAQKGGWILNRNRFTLLASWISSSTKIRVTTKSFITKCNYSTRACKRSSMTN
nr:PD-(D/E)XK nuclease family transposase [Candidatus Thiosymbion oneisti]